MSPFLFFELSHFAVYDTISALIRSREELRYLYTPIFPFPCYTLCINHLIASQVPTSRSFPESHSKATPSA